MKTVLQKNKECYVCNTTYNLHDHHIFFGINRKWSEKYGLKVWLCLKHHTGSNYSVHHDRQLDLHIKQIAQKYFESEIGTRDDFRKVFGKSYL